MDNFGSQFQRTERYDGISWLQELKAADHIVPRHMKLSEMNISTQHPFLF